MGFLIGLSRTCRFRLWLHGIEYSDISIRIILYDPANQNRGVLSDFDLALLRNDAEAGASGKERMGTVPFMALDLLTDEYFNGKITWLYRHDYELVRGHRDVLND